MQSRILGCFLSLLCLGFFLAGCTPAGPARHDVIGKVTNGGQPMKVKEINGQKIGRLKVWLVKAGGQPPFDEKEAVVEPDGGFSIKGDQAPLEGKYKVCVTWQDDYPLGPDKLKGKFNQQNSKIVRDIPTKEPIVLDVIRPEG